MASTNKLRYAGYILVAFNANWHFRHHAGMLYLPVREACTRTLFSFLNPQAEFEVEASVFIIPLWEPHKVVTVGTPPFFHSTFQRYIDRGNFISKTNTKYISTVGFHIHDAEARKPFKAGVPLRLLSI